MGDASAAAPGALGHRCAGLPGHPLTRAKPLRTADLREAALRLAVFFATPVLRFAARLFGLMARSNFPAALLAPAAATFSWLLTVRFALPMARFARVSAALALRLTLAVAARALFLTSVRAFPARRLASEAATFARLTSEVPAFCALSLAASTASPTLVSKPFLSFIDSPVRDPALVCQKGSSV